ncbi:AAA family ATPase [Svornostia abyssi]|uniref:AAA family ATPase n=1 Tax=Svornostia abyssi TaxID=2898438 RepID=A0ABY5PJR3_9ACTN|nr:AAA family ATPase [Parviterribacteraceae bacterium J379]
MTPRLAELFDWSADAVVLVGPTGMISSCNTVAADAFGVASGDAIDVLFRASGDADIAAREIVPRAVREGKWAGGLPVTWPGGSGPARGVVFGHRAPEGELLAVSVVCDSPSQEGTATFEDLAAGRLALPSALRRALGAARALAAVHRHGLVHRDVQSSCFVAGETEDDVRITGLGSARPLAPGVLPPREVTAGLEGALEYLSPELTGRVNRAVDRRSDLYSLGVVLYELLSGELPLQADDPLEWVHCHVARVPDRLRERAPAVPAAVDRIVMRLLAKNPDDRYQTATGVVADLEQCLAQLRDTGKVDPFPLGDRDASDLFAVPQRLYGRTAERDLLNAAFARVSANQRCELALVAGAAGIGKSSLVQALREPATQARGTFVSGKLDGVARDVPYSPFAQAIGELVQQALADPPSRLQQRRDELRAAVGANGAIICELVPRAEILLGACPPVSDLPLPEAQRRVHRVIGDVLDIFAAEYPVVLFVDDLQWADQATLQLVIDLVTRDRPTQLFVVGAYRSDEIDAAHPLTLALLELRATAAPLELELGPLDLAALQRLLDDTLRTPTPTRSFAALVRDKTGGTPYFVLQFLHALHRRGLITVDADGGGWRWDRAEIAAADVTDNVVDMMTQRLLRLPAATQAMLTTAACLGDRVELRTLAVASGQSEREAEEDLWDALRERLLVAREPGYRFSHDRVQQAAYGLIEPAERAAIHLRIGRLLRDRADPETLEAQVFAIVGHLNAGRALIDDPRERRRCAALNLRAGTRALSAAAVRTAARYLRIGIELLPAGSWEAEPRLTLDLHLACARCEHAGGDLDAAERLIGDLLEHASEPADIAAAAQLRVDTHLARSQPAEAADAGVRALHQLGVMVNPDPTHVDVNAAYDRIWELLGDRPIEALLDLPPTDDARIAAATGLLGPVMTPAFLAGRTELGTMLMAQGALLSLEHGNAPLSPLLHAIMGSMLAARFGRYDEGRRIGHAAHGLAERLGIDAFAAQTGVYVGLGSIWTDPYPDCLALVRSGFEHGVRAGGPRARGLLRLLLPRHPDGGRRPARRDHPGRRAALRLRRGDEAAGEPRCAVDRRARGAEPARRHLGAGELRHGRLRRRGVRGAPAHEPPAVLPGHRHTASARGARDRPPDGRGARPGRRLRRAAVGSGLPSHAPAPGAARHARAGTGVGRCAGTAAA